MFNFKKIASVLTSAVMLSSTIGFAAAASYPMPFVDGGTANGAVVYGANSAISDVTAAIDVQQKLGTLVSSGSGGSDAAISGEAIALFTGGTKLYIDDPLNSVKSVLTSSGLPSVLKKETFSGNVDASITQTINIGSVPEVVFAKAPTSKDEPSFVMNLSTSAGSSPIYRAEASFSKAVALNHSDSEGEDITLFGQTFTISAATDTNTLVLLKSAEKFSLDTNNPSNDVTIEGSVYTIELVSASDSAATIKVTDSSGNSDTKEINEAASKTVNGVTIAVTNADETNLKLSATVVAGSDKISLKDGSTVKQGESDTTVKGTTVGIQGGLGAVTKITVNVTAADSASDALRAGESFIDPVFGSFKVDFAGLNIKDDDLNARETITISNSGDYQMEITFTDYNGDTATIQFSNNNTAGPNELMHDDDYHNITVVEKADIHYLDYVVVGNENDGALVQLTTVSNDSDTYTGNDVEFLDVFSGDTYETTFTSEGAGTVVIKGLSYTLNLSYADSSTAAESYNVTLDYPDSSGAGSLVVYPTIETSKGAKLAFYEPAVINATSVERLGEQDLTQLRFPDGDGYTNIAVVYVFKNITVNSVAVNVSGTNSTTFSIGPLIYNVTTHDDLPGVAGEAGDDSITILLHDTSGNPIYALVIVIFEEKDDNSIYQALIIKLDEDYDGSDKGVGVSDVMRTFTNDSASWEANRASDNKVQLSADLWGTIIETDNGDSDQSTATIWYPDEQVYAQIYIAEVSAAITPGSTGGGSGGQVMIVKDSEVNSVAGKNLFVVGGSCINTVAAKILGSDSPLCTSDFTDASGAGPGQYILKSVVSPYSDDKVALLVAGYAAADTVNAVDKALEGVTTDAGTEQVYPITSA